MFFENERIVNKQLKFVKIRAYTIIQDLESKGLGDKEIAACISLLMKDDSTEYQQDVLKYALKVINLRQEKSNDTQTIDPTYSFVDGRVQCKISPVKIQTPRKRKACINNKNRK